MEYVSEFISNFIPVLDMILAMAIKLFLIWVVVTKGPAIIVAFRGSDGKFQVEEIGKLVLLVLVTYAVLKEITREHEWRILDGTDFGILLAALFSIAGLKELTNIIGAWKNKKEKQNGEG